MTMNWWNSPVDVKKNSDGTYTQWGKKRDKKPYWRIGSPRGILAGILTLVLLLWLGFMPVVFSAVTERILMVVVLVYIAISYYLEWRNYRQF